MRPCLYRQTAHRIFQVFIFANSGENGIAQDLGMVRDRVCLALSLEMRQGGFRVLLFLLLALLHNHFRFSDND